MYIPVDSVVPDTAQFNFLARRPKVPGADGATAVCPWGSCPNAIAASLLSVCAAHSGMGLRVLVIYDGVLVTALPLEARRKPPVIRPQKRCRTAGSGACAESRREATAAASMPLICLFLLRRPSCRTPPSTAPEHRAGRGSAAWARRKTRRRARPALPSSRRLLPGGARAQRRCIGRRGLRRSERREWMERLRPAVQCFSRPAAALLVDLDELRGTPRCRAPSGPFARSRSRAE